MNIATERLRITELNESMTESMRVNSMDEDNRRFVPDEVFETTEEARNIIRFLISAYEDSNGPFVYAVLTQEGQHVGYVQAARIQEGWEIGYHIAKPYTGKGYATEALRAFLPFIAQKLGVTSLAGICLEENTASARVLVKCGFQLQYKGIGPYQGVQRPIRIYRYS